MRGNGRYLADHIPQAHYLELSGADHLLWAGDTSFILNATSHFSLTDQRRVEHGLSQDFTGLAVHVAARVMAIAKPGHVLFTRTVVDLRGGGDLEFVLFGSHELKGISEPMELFEPQSG